MRFSIITISFFLIVLFLTHSFLLVSSCPTPVPEAYRGVTPGKVVAAYFGGFDGHRYNVEDIEPIAPMLTHVLYAFACPDKTNGVCTLADPLVDVGFNNDPCTKLAGNFAKLLQLKQKYPHLKILLSVGGGACSKAISSIARQGNIKRFAYSVIQLLDRYQCEYETDQPSVKKMCVIEYPGLFDGVDIDWEWTNATEAHQDAGACLELFKQLYYLLKKHTGKQILTSALQVNEKIIHAVPVVQMAAYVDWFHVMTYDYGGPKSSGVSLNAPICNNLSNYSIDYSLNFLMKKGVSPAKMILGIPLYGHVYDNTEPKLGAAFDKTKRTKSLLYDIIKKTYVNNDRCQTSWHDIGRVPYAYCPDDGIFVSYDDEDSVAYKVSYARSKRLKGVFFWRLSGDDADHSLVRAAGRKK